MLQSIIIIYAILGVLSIGFSNSWGFILNITHNFYWGYRGSMSRVEETILGAILFCMTLVLLIVNLVFWPLSFILMIIIGRFEE